MYPTNNADCQPMGWRNTAPTQLKRGKTHAKGNAPTGTPPRSSQHMIWGTGKARSHPQILLPGGWLTLSIFRWKVRVEGWFQHWSKDAHIQNCSSGRLYNFYLYYYKIFSIFTTQFGWLAYYLDECLSLIVCSLFWQWDFEVSAISFCDVQIFNPTKWTSSWWE